MKSARGCFESQPAEVDFLLKQQEENENEKHKIKHNQKMFSSIAFIDPVFFLNSMHG